MEAATKAEAARAAVLRAAARAAAERAVARAAAERAAAERAAAERAAAAREAKAAKLDAQFEAATQAADQSRLSAKEQRRAGKTRIFYPEAKLALLGRDLATELEGIVRCDAARIYIPDPAPAQPEPDSDPERSPRAWP